MAFKCLYCGLQGSPNDDGSYARGKSCHKSPSGVHKIFTYTEAFGKRFVCNYCGTNTGAPSADECRKSPDKAHDWHEVR